MSEQEMRPEQEEHAEADQTAELESAVLGESVDNRDAADDGEHSADKKDAGDADADSARARSAADQAEDDHTDITPILEALIFAAEDALTERQIVSIVHDTVGSEVTPAQIARSVAALNDAYEAAGRAFRIHVWGGGYRMATTPDYAPFVKTLYYQQKVTKLSRSLLETLAILAYKQPATKPELDYVRGVDCDHALRRLLEMGLVEIAGRADTVGRPLLYQTTAEFMDKFGLSSIEDLPTLREIEELMEDPTYSKEHARLLFREGLGLDGEPEPSDDDSLDSTSPRSESAEHPSLKDEAVEGESVGMEAAESELSERDSAEPEPVDRASLDNESLDNESLDNESLDNESLGSKSVVSEPSEDRTVEEVSRDMKRIDLDIEGDGAVGSTDGYVLGGGPDPTQPD